MLYKIQAHWNILLVWVGVALVLPLLPALVVGERAAWGAQWESVEAVPVG